MNDNYRQNHRPSSRKQSSSRRQSVSRRQPSSRQQSSSWQQSSPRQEQKFSTQNRSQRTSARTQATHESQSTRKRNTPSHRQPTHERVLYVGGQAPMSPLRRALPFVVVALIALLAIVALVQCTANNQKDQESAANSVPTLPAADTQQTEQTGPSTTITITALGDCTLGTDPNFNRATNFITKYNDTSASYFFKNVVPYTGSDDLTIANFEGTLTESDDIQEKTFNFKAPASYAKILTEGSVETANLANNHSYDYGQQGFDDTKENLEAEGIIDFGYAKTATTEVKGVKIGLFGISQLGGADTASQQTQTNIQALQEQGCQLIIGVFHWGIERDDLPTANQVELAHEAIDAGCDLVIGGHPHVLQGVEYYHDRYICYSMGNFCFGGNSNPSDKDTMMYQQTFTFENGQLIMNDETRTQACIIPCSISSSSSSNNYQPTPLAGSEGKRIVDKVNKRSNGLTGTSVEFSSTLDDEGRAAVTQ